MIIKNCPNFQDDYFSSETCSLGCIFNGTYTTKCESVTNCLIKQIADKCQTYRNMQAITTEDYARKKVALKILDILEIEETNE